MRHKFLAFLEAMMELEDSLDELVEADETYVIESQKKDQNARIESLENTVRVQQNEAYHMSNTAFA